MSNTILSQSHFEQCITPIVTSCDGSTSMVNLFNWHFHAFPQSKTERKFGFGAKDSF